MLVAAFSIYRIVGTRNRRRRADHRQDDWTTDVFRMLIATTFEKLRSIQGDLLHEAAERKLMNK